MDSIESNVKRILSGEAIDEYDCSQCDYSLKDQIHEMTSKGIETQLSEEYKPLIGKTVTYIVAAVLFRGNEVLMIQEAKSKYAGQWYLPAGRIEPNEQIVDAVKREVLEETGLEFEPTTLLMVESRGNWFRFLFTGQLTGGTLKTVAQADSESLQANWISDLNELSLRADDCLRLIDCGRKYIQNKSQYYSPQLTVINPHRKVVLRIVVVIRRKENNRCHVLVSETESPHLPVCEVNPSRSIHAALKRFMGYIFGVENLPDHRPVGILSVEHNGIPLHEHDGLCLSLLIACKVPLEEAVPKSSYTWLQVEPELEGLIMAKLNKFKTICLSVI